MNAYIEELEDGVYIQQSLESVMLNEEGKQLMVQIHLQSKNTLQFKYLKLSFIIK